MTVRVFLVTTIATITAIPNKNKLQPQQYRYSYCTVKGTSSDTLSLQMRFLFRNDPSPGGTLLPAIPCRAGVSNAA